MVNIRSWLYRILIMVGIGLMLYTWFQPWWQTYIVTLKEYIVTVFPYGMIMGDIGAYNSYVAGAEDVLPKWFTPAMWVYLGICIIALLLSMFLFNEKKVNLGRIKLSLPQVIVSVVGLSYIVAAAAAFLLLTINVPNYFEAPVQGSVYISMGSEAQSWVNTGFTFHYWLAGATGLFLLIIGFLRNIITGKKNP